MTFTPYRAADALLIKAREPYPGDQVAQELERRGPGWTVWDGQTPVMCAGVAVLWPGVGEVWMFVSDWVIKHPLFFHRACRQYLDQAVDNLHLWRIQSYVRANEPAYLKWAEFMGFEPEGVLRQYGPDRVNYVMYGKVKH